MASQLFNYQVSKPLLQQPLDHELISEQVFLVDPKALHTQVLREVRYLCRREQNRVLCAPPQPLPPPPPPSSPRLLLSSSTGRRTRARLRSHPPTFQPQETALRVAIKSQFQLQQNLDGIFRNGKSVGGIGGAAAGNEKVQVGPLSPRAVYAVAHEHCLSLRVEYYFVWTAFFRGAKNSKPFGRF